MITLLVDLIQCDKPSAELYRRVAGRATLDPETDSTVKLHSKCLNGQAPQSLTLCSHISAASQIRQPTTSG